MKKHYIIPVVAALIIGLGTKQFFFPPIKAVADIPAISSVSMNVLQMNIDHPNRNSHPQQKMNDMSFVFSETD